MKVTLAVVGRLKDDYLVAAEAEYRKRLRPYCTLDVVEHKTIAALLPHPAETLHLQSGEGAKLVWRG